MKSWRSRIAAGFAIGVAAISIPLTAGAAHAADWVVAGGGYGSYLACWEDGQDYIAQGGHGFTQFDCRPSGNTWTMWVR